MMGLITMLVLLGIFHQYEPAGVYDSEFYQPYEQKFSELSSQAARRDSLILAQHYPESSAGDGTTESQDALVSQAYAGDEAASDTPDTSDASDEQININTAGQDQLEELPGIGPAIARRIIEFREDNGPFENTDQLRKVRGIGEARLENIRPYIKIE